MKISSMHVFVGLLLLVQSMRAVAEPVTAIIGAITGTAIAAGSSAGAASVIIKLFANSYGRGAGRIPNKRPCPRGTRDDGTSCWSDAHVHGKGCCCTVFTSWWCCNGKGRHPCKAGYHDDGCTCRKTDVGIKMNLFQRQYCRKDEDLFGAMCYPKCKPGYTAAGCCVCYKK